MRTADRQRDRFPRGAVWAVAAVVTGLVLFTSGYALASHHTSGGMDHQAMIEASGAQVMPFDQNTTTHIFEKTAAGGVESVVANDAQDQQQMGLIRSHLREEATKFTQGNYADPARIHGMDMPGLKELELGYSRVLVVYAADQPNGANITYTSRDPVLVEAIHAWFERQLADHGAHATGG
jgi:hypothetical protein